MKMINKSQLAEWYVRDHSDCGEIKGYFGSDLTHEPVTEEYFFKYLMKKPKDELINMINNHSDEGQEFLKENGLKDLL